MTENVSNRYADFDKWSADDAVEAMYEGQLAALAAIRPALSDVARAASAAASALGKNGRLVYVGSGTSGRLAVQDGAELTPTFNWPSSRTLFCMAGGLNALTESVEGAEDSADAAMTVINHNKVGPGDVVLAVAASGKTPFTLGAIRQAKRNGALTIGIVNNPATPIAKEADYAIVAETGSELVAGSTRMKAGTAQKAILNMISTAVMSRLGRVYKGYMVDMVVSNQKLERRAVGIVGDIAGCSPEHARQALGEAENNIKQAILICLGCARDEGVRMLAKHNGNLRLVLDKLQSP